VRWSWKLGEVAGIGIFVHATFLMLIAWVAFAHWMLEHSAAAALVGALFVLALFACVVLHELGHALTAKRFGVRTRDITLYPIGGVARLERIPEEPRQELVIGLAGPAVNLVLAGAIAAALAASRGLVPLRELEVARGPFLERLLLANLLLAGFNLLPAFPMDGGRVLRAVLATRMSYVRATEVAASVGQTMAFLFGLAGLLVGNPVLLFIALFVWLGAAGEAAMAQMRAAFSGLPVSRAMMTDFAVLAPGDPLRKAVELTLQGSQSDFPVLEAGRPVGILPQGALLAGLAQRGPDARVADVMRPAAETVDPREMIDDVFARFQGTEARTIPVVRDGEVVGLLTHENLGELVRIQAALAARRPRPGPAGAF
jgi:Zn-dependent protease